MIKKFTNRLKSILLTGFLLSSAAVSGQTTGSFNTNISFMGQNRQLSVYVPASYDSTTSYSLMVCLHGLGDNSANYRDAIVSRFSSKLKNTIFVCPEGYTTTSDFYSPAGHEAIVGKSIEYAKSNYNIDTTAIILQGFSLGGRAALRYSLDHPSWFKAVLLNTPAIQGIKEAADRSFYKFNYKNAPKIPVYITVGLSDLLYVPTVDSMYQQLVRNDGVARFTTFPGGHNIPPFANMSDFPDFVVDHAILNYDLALVHITAPKATCNPNITSSVLVQNVGRDTIKSIDLEFKVDGSYATFNYKGTLLPYQHKEIAIPLKYNPLGKHQLEMDVAMLNDTISDSMVTNNTIIDTFEIYGKSLSLPVTEGFEANFPPDGWTMNPSGEAYTAFDRDNSIKRSGNYSMYAFNTALIFDVAGNREEMISPIMDFTTISKPALSFDVAYNYQHYTPPYLARDTVFADTLEVLVSNNCGATYTSVYKKGGKQLATFKNPILNPLSVEACFINPADSNWRTEWVDLKAYATNTDVLVKFRYISDLGGSIFIDNVRFGKNNSGIKPAAQPEYKLYPNPATDLVSISSEAKLIRVDVTDIYGRTVLTHLYEAGRSNEMKINTSGLSEGVYFFQILTDEGVTTSKVIIK